MMKPGDRNLRVNINPSRQDDYDRIRPQGGRSFRALQSLGSEYRRDSGKRDGGTGDVSERRSCARGANTFVEGAAKGGGEALRVRRLFGDTTKEFLNCHSASDRPGNARWQLWPVTACSPPCLLLLLIVCSTLLCGCGARQHTPTQVPPPPSLPREQKPVGTPPSAETTGEDEKIDIPAGAKPLFEETGIASW